MAQVTVDISEYDALRGQNEERRQKIEKQEKEIEDLKSGTRTLFKSCVKIPNYSINSMMHFLQANGCRMGSYMMSDLRDISEFVNRYLTSLVSKNDLRIHSDSQQYVNFDDIVCSVRGDITKEVNIELDEKREELDKLSKKYNQTEEEIYKACKEQFDHDIDELKKIYREKFEGKKEEIAALKKKLERVEKDNADWKHTVGRFNKMNWIQRMFINVKTKKDE